MAEILVMRQPVALRVAGVVALGALAIALAVGGLVSGGAFAWLGLVAAALVLVVTVRSLRLRVVVSGERLLIANLFGTHEFAWPEVERVVLERGVVVRLRSGRRVGVSAFGGVPGALPSVRRRNARAAKRLQAAVKHHRRH